MKLLKKAKKGFTLIELVVVIAVIAILAAISVFSYMSITNKAKESNDHMVIDQINTSLLSSQILEKKATVHEIVERFDEEEGYDVRTIKPELKNARFVYSYEKGKFGYWKDDKVAYPEDLAKIDFTGSNDLWFFEDEAKTNYDDSYSHYLKAAGTVTSISAKGGIDVGECTTISSINLTRTTKAAKDVVIRTNSASTSLTIDAAADTVKHYGEVGSLNIIAVANMSYHEYGQVAFAEIATGRIVLESDSEVEHIHLTATEGNFVDITVAKASDVEMPEFSRDPVEIPEEGKLVGALQDGTETTDDKDYIWLTAVGIYEQVAVSDSKTVAGNNYVANTSDEEKKDTAQQIANNISFSEGGEEYKVSAKTTDGGNTWTYEIVDENGAKAEEYSVAESASGKTVDVTNTSGESPVAVETNTQNGLSPEEKEQAKSDTVQEAKETACEHHIMFDEATQRFNLNCPNCGLEFGTEEHPYTISNAAELEALIKLRDWTGYAGYYQAYRTDKSGEHYDYLYAELTADIDCSTINYPTGYSNVYYLVLDGKNHTLSNMSASPFNNGYGITMKNITFEKFSGSSLFNYCYYGFDFRNLTFNECTCDYIVTYPIKGAAKDDFYCKNVNFNDSSLKSAFSYIYDAHLKMENCTFTNCSSKSGSSLVVYGGYHYYSGYSAGLDLYNVDIIDSRAYGGAYVYYGGNFDFPINFKYCDVSNTRVTGGNGMALGGFVGNASSSHVVFNYCTFDGSIESVSQIAAGFIGQPNNSAAYCSISNSSISSSTVILNKGGTAVAAFNGQGNDYNDNNNHFYGTLQATGSKTNAKLNGFADATFAKYNAAATIADFVLEEDGTLKYTGSQSFDRIIVSQRLAVDEMKSGLGGYPWEVSERLEAEGIEGETTLGKLDKVTDFVQVVDQENLELVRYASTDRSLLSGNCISESNGIYLNNGKLVLNSTMYQSGVWYVFSNTGANSTKTTFNILVLIEVYNGGELLCSVPMSYSFTPTL